MYLTVTEANAIFEAIKISLQILLGSVIAIAAFLASRWDLVVWFSTSLANKGLNFTQYTKQGLGTAILKLFIIIALLLLSFLATIFSKSVDSSDDSKYRTAR
jgi:hypothetical protein